jgi:hypothetical protein
MLGIEPRVSHMLSKIPAIDLHSWPCSSVSKLQILVKISHLYLLGSNPEFILHLVFILF